MRKGIILLASILAVTLLALSSAHMADAGNGDTSEETEEIELASGTCGTNGNWSWKGGMLTISGTGNVSTGMDSDGTAKTSWGSWKLEKVNDEPTTEGYTPSEIFGSSGFDVTISSNVTISSGAFKDIKATSVTFGTGVTSVSSGAFSGCTTLSTVSFGSITSIGADAFSGCTSLKSVESSATYGSGAFKDCTSLTTVKLGTSTDVNRTAFEGCKALTAIEVSSSNTKYSAENGLIYTKDFTTLYMCPTGKTGTISKVNEKTVTVNLDYADVQYILDLASVGDGFKFDTTLTGAKAVGFAYSMQGMSSVKSEYKDGTLVLTCTMYKGWVLDSGIATVNGSTGSLKIDSSKGTLSCKASAGKGYIILPMGKEIVTEADLKNATSIGGWDVTILSSFDCETKDGAVTDINAYECNITGFSGSGAGILGETILNHGAECSVAGMVPGNYGSLESILINSDMTLATGTFANSGSLKSVTADQLTSVGDEVFRYCTGLEDVSLKGCTSIGKYAFEGCGSLSSLDLGASKVTIGEGAFNNCRLEFLRVGFETEVDAGIPVIHCDSTIESIDVYDDYLWVRVTGGSSVSYGSGSAMGSTAKVYAGNVAAVPMEGDVLYMKGNGSGSASSSCLVAFDSRLGMDVDPLEVTSGSTLGDKLPVLSKDGYTFLGWTSGGSWVTSSTVIGTSMMLEADWQKESRADSSGTYVLAAFGVAVIATIAVLAINRYR